MPDREKIIECLELCSRGCNDDGCMYNEEETKRGGLSVCRCVDLLARDALTLLKEQEAVFQIEDSDYIWVCGECGEGLYNDGDLRDNYCSNCGRKVRWE